jgi:hypothetical protein
VVAVAVEIQVNPKVVVAVDEHTRILIDEISISHCDEDGKPKP